MKLRQDQRYQKNVKMQLWMYDADKLCTFFIQTLYLNFYLKI